MIFSFFLFFVLCNFAFVICSKYCCKSHIQGGTNTQFKFNIFSIILCVLNVRALRSASIKSFRPVYVILLNVPIIIIVRTEQTNKCASIKYILSYIAIHQHVSVANATIIRVTYKNTNNNIF